MDEFEYNEISPFCIGFGIFQFLLAGLIMSAIYKVISNPLLIIRSVTVTPLLVEKSMSQVFVI